VIARYREFLPLSESTPIISLGEGGTPLIFSSRLSAIVGRGCEVYLKYEGLNPTCSFKDRGMTLAVSKAVERGTVAVICASTGNTSASAAAYAARAGIRCAVVLPAGKIASGKLLQAFAYGSKVVAIDGNFDDALLIVRALGRRDDFAIVNSINMENGRKRIDSVLPVVKANGAAVVALTIDEVGMAKTAERKLEIARRIHDIATAEFGLAPEDIIFDALTFTLATGEA